MNAREDRPRRPQLFGVRLVTACLKRAAKNLVASQPNLFAFTDATRQSEWNIAGHYAAELAALFPTYDMDCDVIKPGFGRKRPDIIIHKRRTHARNYLVVEVKRHNRDVPGEILKIRTAWFQPPLRYQYGAVVVIDGTGAAGITVVRNPAMTVRRARKA